jgi:hypothetical protein
MEPIVRITRRRDGVDAVFGPPPLPRVEREEPREDPEPRRRPPPPRRQPPPPDDGRMHVDVEA